MDGAMSLKLDTHRGTVFPLLIPPAELTFIAVYEDWLWLWTDLWAPQTVHDAIKFTGYKGDHHKAHAMFNSTKDF